MKRKITTVVLLSVVVFAGAAFGSSALAIHQGNSVASATLGHPSNTLPIGPQTGNTLLDVIEAITDWLFALLLIAATIFIILAAFQFVTGGGDAAKVTEARQKILYAIIAVIVATFAKGIPIVIRSIVGT